MERPSRALARARPSASSSDVSGPCSCSHSEMARRPASKRSRCEAASTSQALNVVPLWAAACSIASASWGGKETDRFTRWAIGSQGSTSGRTGSVGRPPPHAGRQQAVSGRQNKQSARQLWQTTIMCFTGQTHNSPSDLAYWGRRTKTSNPRVGGSSPSGRAESIWAAQKPLLCALLDAGPSPTPKWWAIGGLSTPGT